MDCALVGVRCPSAEDSASKHLVKKYENFNLYNVEERHLASTTKKNVSFLNKVFKSCSAA